MLSTVLCWLLATRRPKCIGAGDGDASRRSSWLKSCSCLALEQACKRPAPILFIPKPAEDAILPYESLAGNCVVVIISVYRQLNEVEYFRKRCDQWRKANSFLRGDGPMTAPAPSRLEAATVTRYAACTVDPRPSRAVHCPDLNACLVDAVDCRAVHFGYAVPVTVEPLVGEPRLAELVLDPSPELSPAAVAYLLERHPQLRRNMAATERLQRQPQPDDDIAAIAKQISDHAEAIYQTWKSRGLAPTEILSCHGGPAAADKFGPALTPQHSPGAATPTSQPKRHGPVVDLLASDASLEQFVNNFVVEDKARLAAARNQTKPLPSSIQYALQKFETSPRPFTPHHARTPSIQPATPKLSPYRKADTATPESNSRKVVSPYQKAVNATDIDANAAKMSPYQKAVGPKTVEPEAQKISPYQKAVAANVEQNAPKVSPYQKLVNANAIDGKGTSYQKAGNAVESPKASPYQKTSEPKTSPYQKTSETKASPYQKTASSAVEHKASPYRKATNAVDPNTSSPYQKSANAAVQPKSSPFQKATNSAESKASPYSGPGLGETIETIYPPDLPADNKPKRTTAYMDEVAREEERLINALKTGVVIAEDPTAPADKKAAILLKKTAKAAAPHPELTTQQRQHLRHSSANPVRPFLTRGSVAERVLIFEKAPSEVMRAVWRSGGHDVQTRVQNYSRDKENVRPSLPPNTTLQRHVKANRNVHIPRFYYPKGKPQADQLLDGALQKIATAFQQFPNQQVPRDKFSVITKACGCPLYWKIPLFIIAGGDKLGYVEGKSFLDFWKQLTSSCHDEASRFMYVLSKGQMRPLVTEDFMPLVQDVVDTHPGLTFLKEATEFHSRYVHTVITRIFYCVNRSWSGKVTLPELRRSDLLRVIQLLEEEEDINQVTAYFSYEHFYVIYCKFWELDRDHDLYIDQQDLARHSDHALSGRMIERIFSGAVTRGAKHEEKMSYTDFVWFLLSEEDKSHPTAIEYWFRCMDLDGDGFLSMYELEYFYEEQLQRMETIGMETLPFEDCLCQMLDMIRPRVPGRVSLTDLKRCKMTPIFFDTFFNLEKYLDHEQRDPFASQREHDTEGHELSDWDRYAAEEYELLVAEEGGNEQQDEFPFDDDGEDDILSPNLDMIMMSPLVTKTESQRNGEDVASSPSFRVTDLDSEDADYAADSDDCSV